MAGGWEGWGSRRSAPAESSGKDDCIQLLRERQDQRPEVLAFELKRRKGKGLRHAARFH